MGGEVEEEEEDLAAMVESCRCCVDQYGDGSKAEARAEREVRRSSSPDFVGLDVVHRY